MNIAPTIDPSLAARITAALESVPDPEIPVVSVVDLGIVQDVLADQTGAITVTITPTYTGCPATALIERFVRDALNTAGLGQVALKTVLSPAWNTDMISDSGREKLRAFGIAPPPKGAHARSLQGDQPVACPHCGSTNTHEVSRFGSTPCKALWRCDNCSEHFDRFKCH